MRELARSWERCQPATRLHVRLWSGDPYYLEYKSMKWPTTWKFYTSDAKSVVEALNEFFHRNPEDPFYGFIADDIVLRTKGGLEHLQALAVPFFLSYPNDTIQRDALCTHFCIGGDFARLMGYLAHPKFEHGYIDMIWHTVAHNCGLLRYAPQVIFHHKHYVVGSAKHDETYAANYTKGSPQPDTMLAQADAERWKVYIKDELEKDIMKVKKELFVACEDWAKWKEEDENRGVLQSSAA